MPAKEKAAALAGEIGLVDQHQQPDSTESLLGGIRDHRYVLEHLRRAIRQHGKADISARSVALRARENIANGRRGVAITVDGLQGIARDMLRRRWGRHT